MKDIQVSGKNPYMLETLLQRGSLPHTHLSCSYVLSPLFAFWNNSMHKAMWTYIFEYV